MQQVKFVWDGDEAGLWRGDNLIATLGELEREGYSLDCVLGMSQKQLGRMAAKFERKEEKHA